MDHPRKLQTWAIDHSTLQSVGTFFQQMGPSDYSTERFGSFFFNNVAQFASQPLFDARGLLVQD